MLKRIFVCAVLMALYVMSTGTAQAVLDPIFYPQGSFSYTITNYQFMNSSGENYTYAFNLGTQTAVGAEDIVESATVAIQFIDDESGDGSENATITIDGTVRLNNQDVNTETRSYNVLSDLASDHLLNANVARNSGDFYINDATLSGTYADNTANLDFFISKLGPAGLINTSTAPFVFTFDLDNDTLDPTLTEGDIAAEDDITYAMLTLFLEDDASYNDGREYVTILINGTAVLTGDEVGDSETYPFNVSTRLVSSHVLEVTVDGVTEGDFYLRNAKLGGEYYNNPTPGLPPPPGVPEPASLSLLGLGLLGLLGRRKRS